MIQASERAKGCRSHSYLCHCSLESRIGPDDEDGGFVDYTGCSRMVRFQGTGVLHLPSNKVDRKGDDRVYVFFSVAIVVFRSVIEEVDLREDLRSTIGIGKSFACSGLGSRG